MKKVLIIGGGSIGKRHAHNLLSLDCAVAMIEVNAERAEALKKEMSVPVYSSLETACAEEEFSIAFICSPSRFHIEQALACAEKNMDLFIEKPLSHTLDGLDELMKITKQKKLVTMVGSNWKFYPSFQTMKEILERGTIGRVLSARCQFGQYLPDWHPYEDYRKGYSANKSLGGGILLDSHEFDYFTWFLGDVKKLACLAGRVSDITVDTEDVAEVILQFANGAIGEIHLDYVQRFHQRNFEFFGELGSLYWNVREKKVALLVKDKEEQEFSLDPAYDLNSMYLDEVRHFLSCVDQREETVTSIAKGAKVVELICAAKTSSEEEKFIAL